jgi:hypothetical protein
MSAGAAQIALKTAGMVPSGKVVLAGQGPLMWLLANQLIRAGVMPVLVETRTQPILRTALGAGGIFSGFGQLAKGIGLILKARQAEAGKTSRESLDDLLAKQKVAEQKELKIVLKAAGR